MSRNCDEDSGRSSCSAASFAMSPVIDQCGENQYKIERNNKTQSTKSVLVVSTAPRDNSLIKSPNERDPFPSCRIFSKKRNTVLNFFDMPRSGGLSNAHSSVDIICSTQIENTSVGENASSMNTLNNDKINRNKLSNFKRTKPVQRAASRLYKTDTLKGKEACIGPEFIVRASQPVKCMDLTLSAVCDKRIITVVLLNGQKVNVLCDPNIITAGQIFEALVHSEKFEHNFMLGIAILLGGDFVFLPDDYKIKKIAPDNWHKMNHKRNKNVDDNVSVTMFLRIKFFLPKNIATNIQEGEWRYRVYLQLRRATVEGQMISTIQNLILLAGYALHIEFGEFSYREHGIADYFLLEHYLPEFLITTDMADVKLRMKRAHESRRGIDRSRAIINYITLAQTFRDYGAHFYSAVWATRDGFCRDVWLSIGPRGITLYSRSDQLQDMTHTMNRIVLQSLPWHHIHTFYYNKKSLYIMPNAYSGLSKIGIKYKLKMSDSKSFFIFWLASLHHRLYLKLYAKDDFISYLSSGINDNSPNRFEVSNYQDSYNLAVRNPGKIRKPVRRRFKVDLFGDKRNQNKENNKPDTEELLRQILSPTASDESVLNSPNGQASLCNDGLSSSESSLPRRHGVKMGTRVFNGMKSSISNYNLQSPQNHMYMKSEGDLTNTQSDSDDLNSEKRHCNVNSMKLLPERQYSQNMPSEPTAYVLESPKVSSDAFNYSQLNESCMNNSIFDKLDHMECVQGERIFITAVLQRDVTNTLGLQVAEGSDGNVYIKSITPESPADLSKKLLPGDQIISVNGQTLLNLKYDRALSMLQNAPKTVELIVLQNVSKNLSQEDDIMSNKTSDGHKINVHKTNATSLESDFTDDELLNEEALKTIYALIKLTKERVVQTKDETSNFNTPDNNLQKCHSVNKLYHETDFNVKREHPNYNTLHCNGKIKRRPFSLSVPSNVDLPDDYLDSQDDILLKKSSLKSIESSLKSIDKSVKSCSTSNVALPRNFGFCRRWLGPVKYPVTPCKNSNTDSAINNDTVTRHFVYGAGDSDEDQIFL
ncbi:unnamed protein product [Leptidea sinapis]|uniref:PDZ domain-containing protein n=1 Tax=Leptidea sinapis TaxID=189913 RepID=A0A5E4QRK9_9NEOP|nr:unnamed protein product [Leptidea sinapis]